MWLLLMGLMTGPQWVQPVQARGDAREAYARSTPLAPVVINGRGVADRLPYRLATRTTNYFHATPSQAKNIELVATRLNGAVVSAGQIFSYYRQVGPYTQANGYGWGRMFVGDRIVPSIGGGVCQGSSTLYSALLRTGLPIVERHQHGLTVPYLPPGEDATVAEDYLNFRFRNNQSTPILITAAASQRHLTVSIWGARPGPEIVVEHQILDEYPFRTITRTNPRLQPGQTVIEAPGQVGVRVKNWLEIKTAHGTEIKNLGIDTYRASPRIVEVGPAKNSF
ncbi:MAG: vanomycin resistance protein VanB [Sulfobacillus acidophilus]|uniref:Vanomycin resistance protein VanB n=1 Tax=Sulfobacillus acidophilus TaxID=53633 RepID=A0A2T2WD03_9FIRM|nr:MAG: vanomycin resistance protein VanB [Sulfobacillus acidophilus]